MQPEETSNTCAASATTGHDLSPCMCPRCAWLGTIDQTGDAASCPQCLTKVNPMRQKGLASLRTHYRRMLKMGYSSAYTLQKKQAERARLEQFFQRVGAPL